MRMIDSDISSGHLGHPKNIGVSSAEAMFRTVYYSFTVALHER